MKVQFRCPAYRCWLSRQDCAGRFRKANATRAPRRGHEAIAAAGRNDALCVGCSIGKLHAAGKEAPDVELRELVPHASALGPGRRPPRREALVMPSAPAGASTSGRPKRSAPQKGAQRREREEVRMPKPTEYTLDGVTKTASEWAKPLGIGPGAIKERLKKGWSLRDALTKPRSPGAGGGKKSSNAAEETRRTVDAIATMGQPSGPRALLELAGYKVREVRTPAGVALLVEVA